MTSAWDYVVAGSGHNAMTASAYLAAAGFKVLVLERNDWIGGGVVTREVTAPGFKHDLHSQAHMLLQANPMIRNDELGLQARFGLQYIRPEISVATVFDDGTSLLTYHDVERTCDSIATFSSVDAEAYRRHVAKMRKLLPMFVSGLFAPPTPFGMFMGILEQSREGRELIGVMNKSAFDIIDEMFENDKVKIHFMKYSSEAMAGPEEKGTGLVFSMLVGFVHEYHGGFPVGGSGALVDSLERCLKHYGGDVQTGCDVSKVLMEGGKVVGVALADGRQVRAKRGVIGCFHPHLLGNYVEGVDPQIIADAKRTHPGPYSSFCVNFALHHAPVYPALAGLSAPLMVEVMPASLQAVREEFDALRYGRMPDHVSLVCTNHTNYDPSRAPEGKSILFLYAFAPYNLASGGPQRWDAIREQTADWVLDGYRHFANGIDDANVIGRYITTPLDNVRQNISFQKGDISGIGRYLYQFLGRRPTPELSQYAVPGAQGLYLCGPFMHPGGGVIGGGRALAVKILDDCGMDIDAAIGKHKH